MMRFSNSCFNPRPHAEGDQKHGCVEGGYLCFNPRPHAEGDIMSYPRARIMRVSIHALTRRATKNTDVWRANIFVSIHALTRRATLFGGVVEAVVNCFNPRPHAEGDLDYLLKLFNIDGFQSTPSRGGRHKTFVSITFSCTFQSTPSRGGRRAGDCALKILQVSIHALTRRAT